MTSTGKVPLLSIQVVCDLDGVLGWLENVRVRGYEPPADAQEASAFSDCVRQLRTSLSPNNHPSVVAALAAQVAGDTSVDFRAVLLAVPRAAEYKAAFEDMALILGRVREVLHRGEDGAAPSRRALNALRRSDQELFTAHAGKVALPPEAATDRHGNAADDTFQLGRDGTCAGMKAVILSLFNYTYDRLSPAWYGNFKAMLERKGLEVVVRAFTTSSANTCPVSPDVLAEDLGNATQLWVISNYQRTLTDDHIAVIKRAWRRGLGLYIAGDNDPYNADANPLLAALGLPLLGGNFQGRLVLTADSGHLVPHPITTGLPGGLYSGITVADFPALLADSGVLHGAACAAAPGPGSFHVDEYGEETVPEKLPVVGIAYTGQLRGGKPCWGIVAFEGSRQTGRVVADGAFTRLQYDWDKHGTPQYVGNVACYLAGSGPITGTGAEAEAAAAAAAGTSAVLDYTNARGFECAISHEDTASQGFVMLYGDHPYDLVADANLNDPIQTGLTLGPVMSTNALKGDTLAAYVRETSCPFTRRAVLATIPLVSLAIPGNVAVLGFILTNALTDGRFTRAAWLMFFGICVAAAQRSTAADPGACPYRWLVDQMLAHITMSASFTAMEPYLPLRDAINVFARPSSTDLFSRLRKSLTTITQGLCPFVADRALVASWVRQKHLLTAFSTEVKAMGALKDFRAYKLACAPALYRCNLGIVPVAGTATVPPQGGDMEAWCQALARVVLLNHDALVSQRVEAFLARALRDGPKDSLVARVWFADGEDEEVQREVDLRARLDAPFVPMHTTAMTAIPPFATVYGPSVLRAPDGTTFYPEPLAALDCVRDADAVSAARRAYLVATFRADTPATASNYPLHAATRTVLGRLFHWDLQPRPEHATAVADYLEKLNKGNIFTEDFGQVVQFAVESFLAARRINRALPSPLVEKEGRLPFRVMLKAEQMVLQATGCWPVAPSMSSSPAPTG